MGPSLRHPFRNSIRQRRLPAAARRTGLAWFSRAAKVSGSRPRMKYRTPQVWIKARTQDRIPAACVTIGEKSP